MSDILADSEHHLTHKVFEFVRNGIQDGSLHPGDRLPPERSLADQLTVSRPTVRLAVAQLAAMGVLNIRRGVGTFVADGSPEFGRASIDMVSVLHGFNASQMFEARIILEGSAAELAAERGREEHFRVMAEQVAEMYANCDSPTQYLIHDVLFHRTIAEAACNPIVAALMEAVSAAVYQDRLNNLNAMEKTGNLKESADLHREIYRAIRSRQPQRARELMTDHLRRACASLVSDEV